MGFKTKEETRAYYNKRYHATREQALEYVAFKHAQNIMDIIGATENAVEKQRQIAAYLKEHCKFKPGMVK